MRYLTKPEKAALLKMGTLIENDALREHFFADLEGAMVDEQPPDAARLIFHIAGLYRRRYQGQDTFRGEDKFPVEGTVADADGVRIEVYLYEVDGRVYELELLRPDAKPLLRPDWQTFEVR